MLSVSKIGVQCCIVESSNDDESSSDYVESIDGERSGLTSWILGMVSSGVVGIKPGLVSCLEGSEYTVVILTGGLPSRLLVFLCRCSGFWGCRSFA